MLQQAESYSTRNALPVQEEYNYIIQTASLNIIMAHVM